MSLNRREFLTTSSVGAMLALHARAAADAPKPAMSPYLGGNFGPIREEITAEKLQVIGAVPAGLNGIFVRNGPNPQFDPIGNYHWFDGDGMLHGVRLQDGKASYRNRYVQSDGYKEERAAGKALYTGMAQPPDLKRLATGKKPFKNTGNTALIWHHAKCLALMEGGSPYDIKLPDLETVGEYTFGGKWKWPVTAHPKVDPVTGEMVFFAYNSFSKPHLTYGITDAKGAIQKSGRIEIPRGVMIHDFAITPKYAVFMDLPYVFSRDRLFRGEPPYKFEPEHGSRFGVQPRAGKPSDIKWFSSPPCFVFHTLNAYEDGDAVVLMACRSNRFPESIDGTGGNAASEKSVLYRWRFNMTDGKVSEGPLDDADSEFPRVPDALLGKQTRFGYVGQGGGEFFDGVIKYDLQRGTKQAHNYGAGRFGGEGIFVPKPDAKAEDDGWLLNYVFDKAANKSEMVIVDAADVTGKPLARVMLPQRVPYGFHGMWVSADKFTG